VLIKQDFVVGDLVMPRSATRLFSVIMQNSADGTAFSPQLGPHQWLPAEMGVIIDKFEMPFHDKRLYRILMTSGGTGWAWEDKLSSTSHRQ